MKHVGLRGSTGCCNRLIEMELKILPKVSGKRACFAVMLRRKYTFVGPFFSTNLFGNNPWTLSGRMLGYLGHRRKIDDDAVVHMLCAGPIALVFIRINDSFF